ncbi:MAG: hypothetical protein K940chlam7_01703 [Chlamydiae bacterium]|nr:hypothetical protein [Chlamydiota bacterium]
MSNSLNDGRLKSHWEAHRIIVKNGGKPLQEPKNIPNDWVIEVIDQNGMALSHKATLYGIKYSNPNNEEEFIKIMPGNTSYVDERYHEPYVIYHHPTPLIGKEFKNKIYFDRNDSKHMDILLDLKKIYNLRERAATAGTILEKYWFTFEDIIFVRKTLEFKPIPKNLLQHIKTILCECHQIALSDTQGGVKFCTPNHHEGVRVAHHISKSEGVFVKVRSVRGYHTLAGETRRHNDDDAHIYNIHEVLQEHLDWYLPHCKKFYRLKKFDYNKAKMTGEYFAEEGKKSAYVQGKNNG